MPMIELAGSQYRSFATVADADKANGGDILRALSWAGRDADTKSRGLVSATRLMAALPWCDPAPDASAGELDPMLVEVTAALAEDLIAKPKLVNETPGESNIKSVGAGSARVEFFSPVRGQPRIQLELWERLLRAGLLCLGDTSDLDAGVFISGISDGCRPFEGRYSSEYWIAAMDHD